MSANLRITRADPHRRFADRSGFTLVEVLVAFTAMAILLSVLFRGVVALRAGSIAFAEHQQVEMVALDVLEGALSNRDLRNGTYSGHNEGKRWTIVAKPIDLSGQMAKPVDVPEPDPQVETNRSTSTTQGRSVVPVGDPSEAKPAERSVWTTQRLKVRVEGTGRPLEIETIRMIKAQ